MKNLFDFVDAILVDGTATYSLVTGHGYEQGFVVEDTDTIDVLGVFGDNVTRTILMHSFVKDFIASHGFVLSDADYSLHGKLYGSMFALSVCKVYDSRKVAESKATEEYYDIMNDEIVVI